MLGEAVVALLQVSTIHGDFVHFCSSFSDLRWLHEDIARLGKS